MRWLTIHHQIHKGKKQNVISGILSAKISVNDTKSSSTTTKSIDLVVALDLDVTDNLEIKLLERDVNNLKHFIIHLLLYYWDMSRVAQSIQYIQSLLTITQVTITALLHYYLAHDYHTTNDTKLLYCCIFRLRMSMHGPNTLSNRCLSSLTHLRVPFARTVAARGRFRTRAISPVSKNNKQ